VLTDVIVCEDQSAYIRCRYPSRISISEAIYGRSADRSICPHPSIRTTHCRKKYVVNKEVNIKFVIKFFLKLNIEFHMSIILGAFIF
jgi:hypothetical protein